MGKSAIGDQPPPWISEIYGFFNLQKIFLRSYVLIKYCDTEVLTENETQTTTCNSSGLLKFTIVVSEVSSVVSKLVSYNGRRLYQYNVNKALIQFSKLHVYK